MCRRSQKSKGSFSEHQRSKITTKLSERSEYIVNFFRRSYFHRFLASSLLKKNYDRVIR